MPPLECYLMSDMQSFKRRKMRLCWILAHVVGVAVAMSACAGDDSSSADQRRGKISYDTSPIDVTGFPNDADVLRRILYMPFGEAAMRLGSLTFEARSSFVFSRSAEEYEQSDVYSVTQDSRGNFHVTLDTPKSRVEIYLVGETVYVRQNHGHLRHKPRRGIEAETWCEFVFTSMHQVLELFRPRLSIVDPKPSMVDTRQAIRYRLELATREPSGEPLPWPTESVPDTRLPVAPPARWRELARPLDLRGALWLDAASGSLSRLSIKGRIEIADREVRPTQLEIHYEAAVTDVGKVAAIEPPESIAEFRRVPRPHGLLDFFADRLDDSSAEK